MNELIEIRYQLEDIAERESKKLFRIARKLEKRGGTELIIAEIRNEAFALHTMANPEKLLAWDMEYYFKYAFK